MFKVNQKVVCVCDRKGWEVWRKIFGFTIKLKGWKKYPKRDQIYRVTEAAHNVVFDINIVQLDGFGDRWFAENAFRPIDENFAEAVLENIKEQIKQEELELIEPKTCKQ